MNKALILNLAQKSDLAELYDHYTDLAIKASDSAMDFDTVVGKFAELIIKECMSVIDTSGDDLACLPTPDSISEKVKDYFGLK